MTLKAIYIYTDDAGRPVLRKCRNEPGRHGQAKGFSVQAAYFKAGLLRWGGRSGSLAKYQPEWGKKVLYNLPVVLDALTYNKPVVIAEGERDADLIAALKKVATTTNHQGINVFNPEQAAWFARPRCTSTIHIVMDDDDPGFVGGWVKYAALTAAGVPASRLRLHLPPKGYNDVTEACAERGLGGLLLRRVAPRVADRRATAVGTTERVRDYEKKAS